MSKVLGGKSKSEVQCPESKPEKLIEILSKTLKPDTGTW